MNLKRYKSNYINLAVSILITGLLTQEIFASQKSSNDDSRVLNATLWVEQIKVPVTQGSVIFIDSLFAVFFPKRALTNGDVHDNIVLQIQGTNKQASGLAKVVDYDLANNLMLVEIKKREIQAPKQKLSAESIAEVAFKNHIIKDNEKVTLVETIKKFEINNHKRGLAEQKKFSELIENQVVSYANKLTDTLMKSNRKMQWSEHATLLLPGVDSCVKDFDFKEKMKSYASSVVLQSYKCSIEKKLERDISSDIKSEFQIYTGIISSSDSYLRVPNVVAQLNEASQFFDEKVSNLLNSSTKCQMNWIAERNIFAKSCIEKSESFKSLYSGVHYFGYYQGQKIIYQILFLKEFTQQNHKDLAEKFLKGTKGGVL